MATADPTLAAQEPDSLEDPGQEPEESGSDQPSPDSEGATGADDLAAADEAAAEQPDDVGAAPAEGDAPAAEAAPSDAGPSEAATSPPAEPDSPAGTPFSYRVDGTRVDVDGATETDGVITIPKDSWNAHVQNRLADRGRIQQREERMQSRIRSLETEAEAREERFKTVLGKVDELIGDPERLQAFAQNYETQAPLLKVQIENDLLKSQTKRSEQTVQSQQQEAEEREFNELAPAALTNAVDVVLDRSEDAAAVDKQALTTKLRELWDAGVPIFFRVKEGDGSGLDPNEHRWGVDLHRVSLLAEPYIERARKDAASKAAQKVAAANAKATGKSEASKAPPTAPASGSPAPGGEAKYPTTREEYEKYKAKRSEEVGLPL